MEKIHTQPPCVKKYPDGDANEKSYEVAKSDRKGSPAAVEGGAGVIIDG